MKEAKCLIRFQLPLLINMVIECLVSYLLFTWCVLCCCCAKASCLSPYCSFKEPLGPCWNMPLVKSYQADCLRPILNRNSLEHNVDIQAQPSVLRNAYYFTSSIGSVIVFVCVWLRVRPCYCFLLGSREAPRLPSALKWRVKLWPCVMHMLLPVVKEPFLFWQKRCTLA